MRADADTLDRIRVLPFVRWVGHLPYRERIGRNVRAVRGDTTELPRTRLLPNAYAVEFFGPEDVRGAKVAELGFAITAVEPDAQLMVVRHDGTLAEQRKALASLGEESHRNLDALAMQLGQLQAQATRLNALGDRLAEVGKLGDGEFDFSSEPALGGPDERTVQILEQGDRSRVS